MEEEGWEEMCKATDTALRDQIMDELMHDDDFIVNVMQEHGDDWREYHNDHYY